MRRRQIFIVTGLSGAGKSQALKVFEDFGFYCVDNMPAALLENFAALLKETGQSGDTAIGIDVRGREFLGALPRFLGRLKKQGFDCKIVFFDAADEVLIQRFSETRHRHPLGKQLADSINEERSILMHLKELAYCIIDTSKMTLGELKESLSRLLELKQSKEMRLHVISFGYKYGIPLDADLVMDVRFLDNPHYVPSLRNKTGLDAEVARHINKDKHAAHFMKKYVSLIKTLLPLYIKEGKSYLTVAIGCTGGRHRSVFVADRLARFLKKERYDVAVYHRELRKS